MFFHFNESFLTVINQKQIKIFSKSLELIFTNIEVQLILEEKTRKELVCWFTITFTFMKMENLVIFYIFIFIRFCFCIGSQLYFFYIVTYISEKDFTLRTFITLTGLDIQYCVKL